MGNAAAKPLTHHATSVHPHVCGERLTGLCRSNGHGGSSPRVWGTLLLFRQRRGRQRFIPTCVGNAFLATLPCGGTSVHPHVCGERSLRNRDCLGRGGSSPRVWGTPDFTGVTEFETRFIPTCVGNAAALQVYFPAVSVHPHVCGERLSCRLPYCFSSGSSPRVWGTLDPCSSRLYRFRFIPTCVGNAHPM